jgi:hypothetical protein
MENRTVKFRYSGPPSDKGKRAQLEKLKREPEHPIAFFNRDRQRKIDGLSKELNMPTDVAPSPGMADAALPYSAHPTATPDTPPRCRHPLYGAMKGYIRLAAGTDLTEPADPEWGERVWGDDSK